MNKDEIAGLVERLQSGLAITTQPLMNEAADVLTTLSARVETLEAELGNEKAHYETAQANWDLCLDRIETLETHNSDAYIIVIDLAASLAAAISLLEKGGKAAKKAAPSDKMFDQMLRDYRESLDRARQALAGDDHG